MGGTISITIREKDGKVHKTNGWTNPMPFWINNVNMFHKDKEHVKNYLSYWYKLMDDYEKNKDTGEYEYDDTKYHIDTDVLAPSGYGLVVVDLMNDIIISNQGYTSFSTILFSQVMWKLKEHLNSDIIKYIENTNDEEINHFFNLYKNGYSEAFHYYGDEENVKIIQNDLPTFISQLIEHQMDYNSMKGTSSILLNHPFELIQMDSYDIEDYVFIQQKLIELGFYLDKKDMNAWKEWFAQINEDEE